MKAVGQEAPVSKKSLWGGWIISAMVVLFLLFDGITKVLKVAPVVEASARLGLPMSLTVRIGILVLILAALYVVPSTSILGAILLTGFLGGAVAIQLRAGSPLFSEALFPVYFAMFVWGGLFLRDGRVRALIFNRS
jgi:hypothetical protein